MLCDPTRTLLGDVVKGILGSDEREVSVYEDKRVLSDPDWDDNMESTLASLNVGRGKFLSIVDEEGDVGTITIALAALPLVALFSSFSLIVKVIFCNREGSADPFVLPEVLPKARVVVKRVASAPVTPVKMKVTRKRAADGDGDEERAAKRIKLESPSKKRRLEEDGLIIMEGVDDPLEDDVIEID